MPIQYFHANEDDDRSKRRSGLGLNEFHAYGCAYCGAENEVYVDATTTWLFEPSGFQRQLVTEECASCFRGNQLNLLLDRDGAVTVEAQPDPAD